MKILTNAMERRFPDTIDERRREVNEWLREYFLVVEETLEEKKGYKSNMRDLSGELGEFVKKHNSFDDLPPCVRKGIELLINTGELVHEWRLHIAAYLLRVWDYDEVVKLFSFASDYSEKITKYQLDYILKNDIYPYSCKNAKAVGICPVKDIKKCPFYVLTDGWIGRPLKEGGSNE